MGRTLEPLKIAIVVQGRFHAFDLARGFLNRGHEITLFTNYPAWAVRPFGISRERVRSFWLHGVLTRLLRRFYPLREFLGTESLLHRSFGSWAASQIKRESWDLVYCWSGIAEETFRDPGIQASRRVLVRGSAHIRTQLRILMEEEERVGVSLDKPSRWMVAREEREYALADYIQVISDFAYRTFVEEGVRPEKLRKLPSGIPVEQFRPDPAIVEQRRHRILAGGPLKVLYVGSLSFRKGLMDLEAIVKKLEGKPFRFRLVGAPVPEAKVLLTRLRSRVDLLPSRPQRMLPECYSWADLFLFPTLEDGFGQVLGQAYASAVPILATTNSGGPNLVEPGRTGWILPVRDPQAFVERLLWCHTHREQLAEMVSRMAQTKKIRSWNDAASEIEELYFKSAPQGSP